MARPTRTDRYAEEIASGRATPPDNRKHSMDAMAQRQAHREQNGRGGMGFLKTALAVAFGLVIFMVGCGLLIAGSEDEVNKAIDEEISALDGSTTEKSNGGGIDTDTRCDYLLGEIGSSGGFEDARFVGSAKATNNEDVTVRVRGRASWDQLGAGAIEQVKDFRVRSGETRTVQFRVPATQDQISAHQSAGSDACRVTAKLLAKLP